MLFSILEYICLFLFISRGAEAAQIAINPGVTATIGTPNVQLWCSYIKDGGEQIYYINMKAKNKTNEYIQIATFYLPESNREADLTEPYLTGRVSLTNPTDESDKAILTFNQIQCVDDTDYICSLSYNRGGKINMKETVSTSINVTSPSAKPDSIISDLPLSGVEDGQYVSFVCKGNVGKPAGTFIWKKIRYGERSPIIYSDVNTTSTEIPGNCTFHGTSNLTIQLTELDNKAKIQCVEESNLSSESLTIETEAITVNCTLLRPDEEEFETTGIIIGGIIAGLIIVMVIVVVLCIRRRRGVNVKLPDNPNQQCAHYSTGDADIEQNNIKSNCTDVDGTCLNNIPNDTNGDVYSHLGDVLRNNTTSPGATGNIYDRVG